MLGGLLLALAALQTILSASPTRVQEPLLTDQEVLDAINAGLAAPIKPRELCEMSPEGQVATSAWSPTHQACALE